MTDCSVIDLFCGAGALTHGFILEGFNVVAGLDADKSCKYAYETNNQGAIFINKKIEDVKVSELMQRYPEGDVKILIGCAPCQPFSAYNKGMRNPDSKWKLLSNFSNIISEIKPDIVSMENVPTLTTFRKGEIYLEFIETLKSNGYEVSAYPKVFCPKYGIPQTRKRLVLLASKSKYGKIDLLKPTHTQENYKSVRDTISDLEPIEAGQTSQKDPYHKAAGLSELNLQRIRASRPGGTWKDWPAELVAKCHQHGIGRGYTSIYGRMEWDAPSPTLTTTCFGFGNGRFGHPEQDRGLSVREAARLQTFPDNYQFVHPNDPHHVTTICRLIGNAVPVKLAQIIAQSIKLHLETASQ